MDSAKFLTSNRERWFFTDIPNEDIQKLSKKFNIDSLLARLILMRKIGDGDENKIQQFISPSESLMWDYTQLTSPENLEKATARIKAALKSSERIMVNGDPDADGITGTAILVSGLRQLGIPTDYDFPVRAKEGHGLQPRLIDYCKENGIGLIVTTDCGSKDIEAVQYANSCGIDVIICDHHILGRKLPNALAMINPNCYGPESTENKLAGAGVSFKFILAIYDACDVPLPDYLLEFMLACVSLGTISDRMSILDPTNRLLVKRGVEAINKSKRHGLRALRQVSVSGVNNVKPREIARTIVPLLNAPGRIGDPDEGIPDSNIVVDLLLIGMGKRNEKKAKQVMAQFNEVIEKEKSSKIDAPALEEAAMVDDVNEKRKYITSKIEDEIDDLIKTQVDPEQDRISIVLGKNWNPGVIGIDTDRLKDRFLRPAMIITEYSGSAYLRGSVRSIPAINMYQVIETVGERFEEEHNRKLYVHEVESRTGKRVVDAFGGHSQACGFSLHKNDLDLFVSMIREEMEKIPLKRFAYYYDILDTINFSDINFDLIKKLDRLMPYGQNFEFPIFYMKNVAIGRGRAFGNKYQEARTPHVDFMVENELGSKSTQRLPAVGFGLFEKYSNLIKENPFEKFDIIFTVDYGRNGKRNIRRPQLRLNVMDIRAARKKK